MKITEGAATTDTLTPEHSDKSKTEREIVRHRVATDKRAWRWPLRHAGDEALVRAIREMPTQEEATGLVYGPDPVDEQGRSNGVCIAGICDPPDCGRVKAPRQF